MGLGVDGFALSSDDFLDAVLGVDEADDLPLLGLTGSFFAWFLTSPFSFGGVLLIPF